jgi:CSLREA domain-containing protein
MKTTTGRTMRQLQVWRFSVVLLLAAAAAAASPGRAQAATFTVNSNDDSNDGTCDGSHCSLREAIAAANAAPGADRIEFNIAPLGSTHIINIASGELPAVLGDLVIDGYTQAGASPNTLATGGLDTVLRIELRTSTPFSVAVGLRLIGSHILIQGLALNNFLGCIFNDSYQAEDVVVAGNFIGTIADGLLATSGLYGVVVNGGEMRIGGASPADRNLISGNSTYGIRLARGFVDPVHLTIQGNLIGTTPSGDAPLANGIGINIEQQSASPDDVLLIGGTGAGEGNVIGASATNGILAARVFTNTSVPGPRFEIAGNVIGMNWARTIALPNLAAGISIQSEEQASIFENVIANSGGAGIAVTGAMVTGLRGVTISRNTIVDNTGPGIDLGADGRTANDAADSDTGPNERLNFPVLTQARVDTLFGLARVTTTIQAEPSSTYTMEFFNLGVSSRPAGSDAANFLFDRTITTDATGAATLVDLSSMSILPGDSLVVTLTHASRGYTSEISDPITVAQAGPSLSGQITRDGGVPVSGAAIVLSGSESRLELTDPGGTYLLFDLTAGGSYTVTPQTTGYAFVPTSVSFSNLTSNDVADFTALVAPASYTVNVAHDAGDGWCNATECTLREAIAEANQHPGADVIRFGIPGTGTHTIAITSPLPDLESDLIIDGYTQPGARPNTNVSGGLNGALRIALVPAAVTPPPDQLGLSIIGSRITVRGLAIAGFGAGALVDAAAAGEGRDVLFEGNYFGTTPDGTAAAVDSMNGIVMLEAAGVTVGGSTPAARNLISGHSGAALLADTYATQPGSVRIAGNLIGTTVNGLGTLPNMIGLAYGNGSPDTTAGVLHVGGDTAAERNVISGNGVGMLLARSPGSDPHDVDHVVAGNYIGVAADGETALGNYYEGIAVCGEAQIVIRRNTIAYNGASGVALCTTPTLDGYGVALSENEIYENAGLAIDLEDDGRTANDADDTDTGTNELQNFPVLTNAQESLHGVRVTGQLASLPNTSYRVELFTAGGSAVEGRNARKLAAGFLVSTDANGLADFTQDLAADFASSEAFVATATDQDRMMTSEVSDGVALTPLPRFGASGTITLNGTPLPNVRVDLTGDRTGSVLSGNDGAYALADLPQGGTYVLTPRLAGYLFTPDTATLAALAANATADFAARVELFTRYLPEGATGSFWETSIALLNASSQPTSANVEFLLPDGRRETLPVALTGPGHAVIDPATVPGLDGATFSTLVTSPVPLVVSRTMRWGEQRELGAHAEQAVNEPRTSWYFGEGATGCFDLFYLLVNPGAAPADVEVTYALRAPAAPLVRHYTVGPFARATIHANAEDGLRAAEVSAHLVVTNGQPIVAERAMYSSCYGATWRGGHDGAASAEPARSWYFAEGATGSFFDLYLLVANFEAQAANVEIEYLLADGSRLIKPYVVPAGSRMTVDVAGESPLLASADVSAIVRSTNDVPVIAERSQWWPHGGWYEGHASAGATESGVEWQLAGAEVGGAHGVQGYLLIANTGAQAGLAQVRAVFADGTTMQLAQPVALAAHSRTTLSLRDAFPQADDRSFGLIVESLGATPAPIVVELSSYNDTEDGAGRRFWGAGTNVLATRIR